MAMALAIGIAASVEDIARRRISNWTCLAALAGGLAVHFYDGGWRGLGSSLLGAAAGFAVFLVFYCLGGMGGGDVKLMAGFGALLGGASRLLEAALWAAAAGGLLAAAVLAFRAVRRRTGAPGAASTGRDSIPYAPAITAGVWLALLGRA